MSKNARELWQKMDGGDQTLASYRRHGYYLKDHRDFYYRAAVIENLTTALTFRCEVCDQFKEDTKNVIDQTDKPIGGLS